MYHKSKIENKSKSYGTWCLSETKGVEMGSGAANIQSRKKK